jgi:hypothetical protein
VIQIIMHGFPVCWKVHTVSAEFYASKEWLIDIFKLIYISVAE